LKFDFYPVLKQMRELLQNISLNLAADSALLYHDLAAAYQQPQRHYHSLQHIEECLQLFQRYKHLAQQPVAVEFALWFHDAVYQPQRHDNEQQSALWADKVLQQSQVCEAFRHTVYQLIMASAHNTAPNTADEKLIVDIDLGILAAPLPRFAQYQQQIRAEYAWVEEAVYQQKRKEVLIRLYNHGDIYHHAHHAGC
jgi:predicted metal-dependent HD superfamily phosphohydrolase